MLICISPLVTIYDCMGSIASNLAVEHLTARRGQRILSYYYLLGAI